MFTLLDLFAGAGGLSTGFDMTEQFNIVGMSENNPNAIKTYEKIIKVLRTMVTF